jgi:hypothetical protein
MNLSIHPSTHLSIHPSIHLNVKLSPCFPPQASGVFDYSSLSGHTHLQAKLRGVQVISGLYGTLGCPAYMVLHPCHLEVRPSKCRMLTVTRSRMVLSFRVYIIIMDYRYAPKLVLCYVECVAERLRRRSPDVGVWGFDPRHRVVKKKDSV